MTHKLVHESKNYEFKCFLILLGEFPVAIVQTSLNGPYKTDFLDNSLIVIEEATKYIRNVDWSNQ